jgi:hypothetical protein
MVPGGPSRQLELRMPGPFTRSDPVVILGEDGAVSGDEHRPERLVALLQSLRRQFHATAQMPQLVVGHGRAC